MATDCFDIPWRNVFANQSRPFPLRLLTWEFEPGWWTKLMAVVQPLVFKEKEYLIRCQYQKPCFEEWLFGECYLWMWVGSHLHFSPSQKYPPVLKTAWAWHITTYIGNCSSHQPIPSPRASWNAEKDISNWSVHTGASQNFLQSHMSTGIWPNVSLS